MSAARAWAVAGIAVFVVASSGVVVTGSPVVLYVGTVALLVTAGAWVVASERARVRESIA